MEEQSADHESGEKGRDDEGCEEGEVSRTDYWSPVRRNKSTSGSPTCSRRLLPRRQLQVEDDLAEPVEVLGRVPAQMGDDVAVTTDAELARRPREFAEIPGRRFVGDVRHDGVVQLDDGRGALGREARLDPVLAVSVNPGAELATQTGFYELHQGLAGEREGRRSPGQQPTGSLAQLETRGGRKKSWRRGHVSQLEWTFVQ